MDEEELDAAERAFLIASTDLSEEDLSDEGRAVAQRAVLAGRAQADAEVNGRWQLTEDGRMIPGLPAVLAALPGYLHPVSVEQFMTTPNEALGDASPVQWLKTRGPVDRVVELADELGYW